MTAEDRTPEQTIRDGLAFIGWPTASSEQISNEMEDALITMVAELADLRAELAAAREAMRKIKPLVTGQLPTPIAYEMTMRCVGIADIIDAALAAASAAERATPQEPSPAEAPDQEDGPCPARTCNSCPDPEHCASLRLTEAPQADIPIPPPIPNRIVLGANGAYWRDFGNGAFSMCPNSTDNDPVNQVAVFVYAGDGKTRACPRCDGGGGVIGPRSLVTCPDCGGTGTAVVDEPQAEPASEPREGMVTVHHWNGGYLGCMGIETWENLLREAASTAEPDTETRP